MSKRAAPVETPVVDDSPPAGKSETLPDEEPYDEPLAEDVELARAWVAGRGPLAKLGRQILARLGSEVPS